MDALKKTLLEAVRNGGAVVLERFQGSFTVDHKEGRNNLVTEVDTAAERVIMDTIRNAFADHAILSEEAGAFQSDSEYKWIIDPIDGTVNFAHGIPICCVSIGLMRHEELVLGAVYNPMMQELFFAEKGKGAFLNDRPIRVSRKTDFASACLVTGFPYEWPEGGEHPVRTFERFILQGLPVRRLGSAAIDLCWVACGRFDGFWEYNLQPWDVAAGYLIVREAGGRVTDFSDAEGRVFDRQTLATNGHIHEDMLQLINNHVKS